MQLSIVNRSKLNPESRIDSEYYKPQTLVTESTVVSRPHWLSGRLFDLCSGPFGSTVTTDKYDSTSKLRYIRGKDVDDFFIDDSDPVYIQKSLFNGLTQYHLKPFDILVTVVGMNFGKCAMVFSDDCPSIFSCKSSLIRNVKVNPFYLMAYFSSKYGYALIRRGQRGAAQPGINLFDLQNIPIPMVSRDFQDAIEKLVLTARQNKKDSSKQYTRAEQLLLSELGLKQWKPQHTLTYVQNYSRAARSWRLDAEHFQPKYTELLHKITATNKCQPLGQLATFIEHGKQPPYISDGSVFVFSQKYIGQQSIDYNFPNDSEVKTTSASFAEQFNQYVLRRNDILHYSVGGNIGLCQPYLDPAIKAMPGSFITLIRADDSKVEPLYLALVLNSIVGRLQTDKWKSASAQPYIYPKDIKNFLIPVLSPDMQNKISSLVQQSHVARHEAKAALQKVKHAVEIATEEDEEKAMYFLRT